MTTITYTHRGWFGLCPVYFSALSSEAPMVDPRHWTLIPLMIVSEWAYWLVFRCCEAMSATYEPEWPLKVTGLLDPPIQRTYEESNAP